MQCRGSEEILALIMSYQEKAKCIPERPDASPLRVGLVGEIYTLIEPYVNLNIENKLGYLGVEVHRGITIADWVKTHLSLDRKYKRKRKEILKKGEDYL